MFLPLELNLPILIGALAAAALKRKGASEATVRARTTRGTIIASGLIAGAAIVGMVLNGLKSIAATRPWIEASRGVARVAHPYDFEEGPLVEYAAWAGWHEDDLCLASRADRLLSSHVAVVSASNGAGCGVVAISSEGLVFDTYDAAGRLAQSVPIQGAHDESLASFELRLPLRLFPSCRERGLRIGLEVGSTPSKSRAATAGSSLRRPGSSSSSMPARGSCARPWRASI